MKKTNTRKALCLMSGGLDSQLVIRLLQLQGIEIHAITFNSLFFKTPSAETACKTMNVPIQIENFTSTLISLIQHPKHGFGAGMNPCIDCHIAMLRRAGQIMEEKKFHFICTGDVLNQRPMSQHRRALDLIASESGYSELVLRPLSAKLLTPTKPEQKGWVDRNQLLELHGRTRKPQIEMASHLGITDYPQPAGGCILTDPIYAIRLKDLKEHEGLGKEIHIARIHLGRHFRLGAVKLIIGRNQEDNRSLEATAEPSDLILKPSSVPGATGLIPSTPDNSLLKSPDELHRAAAICARYSDCPAGIKTSIEIHSRRNTQTILVMPMDTERIEQFRI